MDRQDVFHVDRGTMQITSMRQSARIVKQGRSKIGNKHRRASTALQDLTPTYRTAPHVMSAQQTQIIRGFSSFNRTIASQMRATVVVSMAFSASLLGSATNVLPEARAPKARSRQLPGIFTTKIDSSIAKIKTLAWAAT